MGAHKTPFLRSQHPKSNPPKKQTFDLSSSATPMAPIASAATPSSLLALSKGCTSRFIFFFKKKIASTHANDCLQEKGSRKQNYPHYTSRRFLQKEAMRRSCIFKKLFPTTIFSKKVDPNNGKQPRAKRINSRCASARLILVNFLEGKNVKKKTKYKMIQLFFFYCLLQ